MRPGLSSSIQYSQSSLAASEWGSMLAPALSSRSEIESSGLLAAAACDERRPAVVVM
jgi:hypothetical protein